MPAIEYGSYYWCVILNGKEQNVPGESVLLHADELAMDPTGALVFKSLGRRPAGTEPQQNEKKGDNDSGKNDATAKDQAKDSKNGGESKEKSMIYLAFAPGSWRAVYAAKLQDGLPALVEHWNAANGSPGLSGVLPANSGAVGYPHRE